jgi:NAD(P)-dependent dehydrogenase (short-subunit alcohol dehydrogenase family)
MKTAFVTGAVMGQGLMLAQKLSRRGWRVFAGVLPGADTTALATDPTITIVPQDVSDTDSVRRSAEIVQQALGEDGLDLLLNVAGVANVATGVIEGLPLDDLPKVFEINTFGQVRTIQFFLPMLRRAKPPARILNFGSGAVLANPPIAGAYNMSKHAVHGLTLTLRHELAAFGIQVASIWPGGVKTNMTHNAHANTLVVWDEMRPDIAATYGPHLKHQTTKVLPDMLEKYGSTPDYVTDQVLKIADLPKLKPAYLVGKDVALMPFLRRWLSDSSFEWFIRKTFKIPSYAAK